MELGQVSYCRDCGCTWQAGDSPVCLCGISWQAGRRAGTVQFGTWQQIERARDEAARLLNTRIMEGPVFRADHEKREAARLRYGFSRPVDFSDMPVVDPAQDDPLDIARRAAEFRLAMDGERPVVDAKAAAKAARNAPPKGQLRLPMPLYSVKGDPK